MAQKATFMVPLLNTGEKTATTAPPPNTVRNFTISDAEYAVFLNKKSKGFYIAVQGNLPTDPISVNLKIYYYMDPSSHYCYYSTIPITATGRTAVFVETKVTPYAVWIAKEDNGVITKIQVFIE